MKSLGLISYLTFILPVGYMLIHWPGETTKTYSQNAARHKASIIYYGAVLAVFLTLLSFFAFGWLIPTLHLSTLFGVVFGIGVAAELLAGLVPETTSWKKTTHIVTSGVMYLATLIIVGMLFLQAAISAVQVICAAAFIVMAAVILAALLFKRVQRYALLLQTIHLACFFGALLAVTYLL